ncbi:hypothetical protein COV18_06090 [Candidatus Woesearchaeota archaeon CG10_big_fil_rev_8_21_14_0_10_37_12]|nr:MAG: hypothetical protein COV18_06090 [Candidatus Woesearchaeota archaeon CG10_big_fil_rev_8_21_14_0_10_37_12]
MARQIHNIYKGSFFNTSCTRDRSEREKIVLSHLKHRCSNVTKISKRLKPILPTLKEKKRYVAFEVISSSRFSFADVSRAIWHSVLAFVGTRGAARIGVKHFADKFNQNKQRGLIKVSHMSVDEMKASLALVTKINNQDVIVRSVGISGMLTKAEKKYVV